MIDAIDLWKRYGRFDALKGLSFNVPEGSTYALVGANGAGKTTTIKLLMNMIEASRGTIAMLGSDSRRLGPAQLAQIGYVSENQKLPAALTVEAYVAYLRPFYPTWDRDLETQIQRDFRLPPDRRISGLSHGMRMKLALMCALAYRPRLLVLDEPFSGLDALVRDELIERLLQQAGEMTVLISSHELAEIESFVTHVGFIEDGRLLFQQSMEDLTARVRAVRVTLATAAAIPPDVPKTWLDIRAAGAVLSFIDTDYNETRLAAAVKARLGEVRRVEAEPADLRAIFKAYARAAQTEEA